MFDVIDRKLLAELHWNCRQTYSQLAKKLRVSKQVVSYRIKQLEKENVIQSYHALIDWRKLGYNALRIYLKWQNISSEKEQEIYREIKANPLFMWSVKFEGEIDIGFYVWIKSIHEFSEYWFKWMGKYGKYIAKQEMYESVNMVHYPLKMLNKHIPPEEKVIGTGEKQEYDNVDYTLLQQVTERGNISLVELARKITMTPKAALYRLRKLEQQKIILGYYALVDLKQSGYQSYKVDFYLHDLSRLKEMQEFAKVHAHIVYRMRTIGGPDFEIELFVLDIEELQKIILEIRQQFSNTIRHHRFHRLDYTLKQVYLPGNVS